MRRLTMDEMTVDRAQRVEVREALRKWVVERPTWDWFTTHTFVTDRGMWGSRKLIRKWIRRLNVAVFGQQAKDDDISVSWVFAEEFQKRGERHYHGLIRFPRTGDRLFGMEKVQERFRFMSRWEDDGGGFARIFPAIQSTATNYVTKYVLKDNDVDLDFRGNDGRRERAENKA